MDLKKLKSARSAVLILGGIGLIVAGIWIVAAALFGAVIGAGVGVFATGIAFLVAELVSE